MSARRGVLFVCLGNICRSPLAKVVFSDLVRRRGTEGLFDIDSCGTGGWHVGGGADPRTIAVARRHGLEVKHTARQISTPADFMRFKLLVAMDRENRDSLLGLGADESRIGLMRSFDPEMLGEPESDLDVPDPYYGAGDGFETVYQMLAAACEGLYAHLMRG
jgi:protein-tyrosine phosphatase